MPIEILDYMKIINCLANSEEKIFQNEEIKLLLSAMNIVPGKYDSKKLRYGKIGITVDADADGHAIALLITAALYYLAPEFIKEGRLCWLRAPLYAVKKGKNTTYYYSDIEFTNAKISTGSSISRFKGLGSMSVEQTKDSMFSEQRRLDILEPDKETEKWIYSLMGSDVQPKKDFIFSNVDFSEIRE